MALSHYSCLLIFLISLFVLVCSNKTQPKKSFYCYHGESDDMANITKMDCSIDMCIMYVTPCQNYWATTCYDPSDPMGITKAFKKVPKLQQTSYLICHQNSGCNKNPVKIVLDPYPYYSLDIGFIFETFKPPKSFDNLLWPSLGKEKPNHKHFLENKFNLRKKLVKAKSNKYYYPKNHNYEFLGQTFNSSKKVWVEYELWEEDSSNKKKLKLTFDLIGSSVVGCIWIATTKKTYGKLNLKQKIFPGQIINVTLSSMSVGFYENNFTLWINDEPLNYTAYNFIRKIKYGGKMSAINTIYSAQNFADFSIAFVEPEPNMPKIHCDEEFMAVFKPNTKLNYTIIDPKQNATLIIRNNLGPNEMIEYEFRNSLCPLNAVTRIQIQAIQKDSINYYLFYTWDFRNFQWTFSRQKTMKFQDCSKLVIKPQKDRWTYIGCQNNNSINIDDKKIIEFTLSSTFKYLVESPIEKFKC